MSEVTEQDIANFIAGVQLSEPGDSSLGSQQSGAFDLGALADIALLESVSIQGSEVSISLGLGFPCETAIDAYITTINAALVKQFSGLSFKLKVGWYVPEAKQRNDIGLVSGVKHIIAVASGKGGVGKSTTAVNLALALQQEGARVGILDADIYGPSQPLLLGLPVGTRPEVIAESKFKPVMAHGLQTMSMGYLVTDKTPMVWRGPMVSGALQQLLGQTLWENLDYLVVDMPPGTGDIQLTLSQRVPVSGAVIVTTPQDIALLDAKKGIEMFRKVALPVMGIVENMATHICSQCGHEEHIFGSGGAASIGAQYDTQVLGSLPLDLTIREQADAGTPTVVASPDGQHALQYRSIARKTTAALALALKQQQAQPKISITDE